MGKRSAHGLATAPRPWGPVASPRGGGGKRGNSPPPNLRSHDREIDADPRRFSCPRKKWEVGLQDLLRRFTCTDAMADVLWSYDYKKKEGVVEVFEGVRGGWAWIGHFFFHRP